MITFDGLLAGEKFLRERNEDFNNGTPDGTHWRLIRGLLSEVFRASGITLEMPDRRPDMPEMSSSVTHQEHQRLFVFLAESDGVDCEQISFLHYD